MPYAGCGWKGVCAEDILLQNENYSRGEDNLIEEAVTAVRDGVRKVCLMSTWIGMGQLVGL
jgi:acetylglutamate kinase